MSCCYCLTSNPSRKLKLSLYKIVSRSLPQNLSPWRRIGSSRDAIVQRDSQTDFIRMLVATAVAVMGLGALLLLNHASWNEPKVSNETMIQYSSAAAAAARAGATVSATAPTLALASMPVGQ
jgi:hypothetical protein